MTQYTIRIEADKMKEYTLIDVRKSFKDIGFKIKTKQFSDFIGTEIINIESGKKLSSILTKDDYANFKPAILLRDKMKGKVFSNGFRVVL
jgi:hypothetical protein